MNKVRLTRNQVLRIRALAKTHGYREIGAMFDRDASTISSIARGFVYAHIHEGILEERSVAETLKAKYGTGYYQKVGHRGGSALKTKPPGFAANRELARRAGAIGGRISRRGKTVHV